MEIKIQKSISKKEFMRFQFFQQRKPMVIVPVTLALFFVGIDIAFAKEPDVIFSCLIAAIIGVFTLLVGSFISFLQFGCVWKSMSLIIGSVTTTFTDTGIHEESEMAAMNLGYDLIFKVCEVKTAFYVFVSSVQAVIIPKRCFESAEDVQAVRELFRKNMPPKKVRLMKA